MTIKGMPVETWAVQFAHEALQTLIDQGVCVRIEISATANAIAGRLELSSRCSARDGAQNLRSQIRLLWNQVAR
jgi:phage gp46-like protein